VDSKLSYSLLLITKNVSHDLKKKCCANPVARSGSRSLFFQTEKRELVGRDSNNPEFQISHDFKVKILKDFAPDFPVT
jgi:hypothetical protein